MVLFFNSLPMKLSEDFYQRDNVVVIARELLGKVLVTNLNHQVCRALIVETEAYAGITDRASHAYGNRFTPRTKTMYEPGGTAYVYLCYGIHHLFNVVTHVKDVPHAVLVRAVEPLEGMATMLRRRKMKQAEYRLTAGPGALSEAMGIKTSHSGLYLTGNRIWIEEAGIHPEEIMASPRVGVAYAGEDALLPWRFRIKDNPWASKAK